MSDEKSPPLPPTKRRRSSLMNRKSSAFPLVPISEEVAKKQYITEANQERTEWYQLTLARRQHSKQIDKALAARQADPPTLNYNTVEGDLSDKDKEFLSQLPNYAQLSTDCVNVLEETGMLEAEIGKLNSKRNTVFLRSRLNALSSNIATFNKEAPLFSHDTLAGKIVL